MNFQISIIMVILFGKTSQDKCIKNNEECNFAIREAHSENDQTITIAYLMYI